MRNYRIRYYVLASLALAVSAIIPALEPSIARAISATNTITVTQAVTTGISISAPSNVTMDALTISQNSAVATTSWTVITNDAAGYTLSVNASQAPALQSLANSFTDQGAIPSTWSVASAYKFGFSTFGTNTTGFGTGTQCAPTTVDVPSTTLLWRGFSGTTTIQVASSTSATAQAGTATTVCFADAQNTVFAPSGTYTATTTATAVAL